MKAIQISIDGFNKTSDDYFVRDNYEQVTIESVETDNTKLKLCIYDKTKGFVITYINTLDFIKAANTLDMYMGL